MYSDYFSITATFAEVKNTSEIIAFGINLRRLREKRNLSQQQLADISDISKLTVQRIENAKFVAKLDVLISISKGLEIQLKELFDY
ncbi:MAG: helix-turn-helix domain-containing protein [Bacteroidota bacterium]